MTASYDLIIIGAGHNGLVTAAYLAQAGAQGPRPRAPRRPRRVLRHRGALARLQGLHRRLRQQPAAAGDHPRPGAEEARLRDAAAEPVVVHPVPGRPLPDDGAGPGDDAPRDRQVLARRTRRRTRSTRRCCTRVADFLEPMLTQTPPDPWSRRLGDLWQLGKLGLAVPQARPATAERGRRDPDRGGHADPRPLVRVGAAQGDDRHRRGHRRVRPAVACPGTAYVLFHHVMGECNGVRGVWGYVRGGMGDASRNASPGPRESHGAEIRTNADGRRGSW